MTAKRQRPSPRQADSPTAKKGPAPPTPETPPKPPPPRRSGQTMTPDERQQAMEAFVYMYSQTANILASCRWSNIDRSTYYEWMEKDETFALRVNRASQEANDLIEAEIHRRAIQGIDKPIYYKGERVDTIKEYSDLLLIFYAKARMPEKYREKAPPSAGDEVVSLAQIDAIMRNAEARFSRDN